MLALAAALGFGVAGVAAPTASQAGIFVSVTIAPPPLPVYVQPPCPGYGFIWVPGYWAWDDDDQDYYWVPGTWIEPPRRGYLWTPGWWEYGWGGSYAWHEGYWGPTVGFYGGISYGFGYTGWGYEGAYWRGDQIFYNRTVNNVTNINNTYIYNKTIINNTYVNVSRVSYNGGPAGVRAQPTLQQRMAVPVFHTGPTQAQIQHVHLAQQAVGLHASANHGAPMLAAVPRPASFQPATIPARPGPSGGNFRPNGQQYENQSNGSHAPWSRQGNARPNGTGGSAQPGFERRDWRGGPEGGPSRPNGYDSAYSAPPRGAAPSQPPGRTYPSQWQGRQDWSGGGRSPQGASLPPRSYAPQGRQSYQSPPGYRGGASPYYGGRGPEGNAPMRSYSPPPQPHYGAPQGYRAMGGPPPGGAPRPNYAPPRPAPPQVRGGQAPSSEHRRPQG